MALAFRCSTNPVNCYLFSNIRVGRKSCPRSVTIPSVRPHSLSAFSTCSRVLKPLALRLRSSNWDLSSVLSVSQFVAPDATNAPAAALKVHFFDPIVR